MVNECCVRGCGKKSYSGCSVAFYRLPTDQWLQARWIQNIPGNIKESSLVCGLHFRNQDFIIDASRKTLSPDAIPSVFPVTTTYARTRAALGTARSDSPRKDLAASSSKSQEEAAYYGQCRCCLESGYLKNMWTKYTVGDQSEVYGSMLINCFCIPWDQAGMSMEHDKICEDCIYQVKLASDFKKRVVEAQEKLQKEAETDAPGTDAIKLENCSEEKQLDDGEDLSQGENNTLSNHPYKHAPDLVDIEAFVEQTIIPRNNFVHTEPDKDPLSFEVKEEIEEPIDTNTMEIDLEPVHTKPKDMPFEITKVQNKNLLEISFKDDRPKKNKRQSKPVLKDQKLPKSIEANKLLTKPAKKPKKIAKPVFKTKTASKPHVKPKTIEKAQTLGVSKGRITSEIPIQKAKDLQATDENPKTQRSKRNIPPNRSVVNIQHVADTFEEALEKAVEKAKIFEKSIVFTNQFDNKTSTVPKRHSNTEERNEISTLFERALDKAVEKAKTFEKGIVTPDHFNKNARISDKFNNTETWGVSKGKVTTGKRIETEKTLKKPIAKSKPRKKPVERIINNSLTLRNEEKSTIGEQMLGENRVPDENDEEFEVEYLEDQENLQSDDESEQNAFVRYSPEHTEVVKEFDAFDELIKDNYEVDELDVQYLIVDDDDDEDEDKEDHEMVEKETQRKRPRSTISNDSDNEFDPSEIEMPHETKTRTYKRYTKEDLVRCVDLVLSSGMSAHMASQVYDIPSKTLHRYLAKAKLQKQQKAIASLDQRRKAYLYKKFKQS